MMESLSKRVICEALGTGFLTTAVVGSGIMAERLAGGNVAIALLANTIATGAVLIALILTFGPFSGAHFNPAVSLSMAVTGMMPPRDAAAYVAGQFVGGLSGTAVAHMMFAIPFLSVSLHRRAGLPQLAGEFVATFGLLLVIWGCVRGKSSVARTAIAVAAYITAAYWFTSSTSFANPAVTVARSITDTFAGIRPADVPAFIAAQALGATGAGVLSAWLLPEKTQ